MWGDMDGTCGMWGYGMGQGMGDMGIWDGAGEGKGDGMCGTWGYGMGCGDMGWDRGWDVWEHMGGYGMGCRMVMGWDGMRDMGTCGDMGWDVGVWDGTGNGTCGNTGGVWDGMQDGTGDGTG